MTTSIEWYAPGSATPLGFTTGPGSAFRILEADGFGPVDTPLTTIKSPSQIGETAVDISIPMRRVVLQMLAIPGIAGDIWDLRRELARAFAPQVPGRPVVLGRLRVLRTGRPAREVQCFVASSDIPVSKNQGVVLPVDVEFVAPYPFWTDVEDTQLLFSQAGGEQWALQFPHDIDSNNIEQTVDNQGDVEAPIVARMYGDITVARIRNLTTGLQLEITGNVPATQYIEVATGFGEKRVDLVTISTGARTSIMSRINLAKADFWSLVPGANVLRFEADINTSGRAELYFRQRFTGI